MTFKDCYGGFVYYHGQGGFIRGAQLEATDHRIPSSSKRQKKVAFQSDASYEAIPVTAKHNIRNGSDESYLRTTVKCYDGVNADIFSPDGGCNMAKTIVVRAATASSQEVTWNAADISFGEARAFS